MESVRQMVEARKAGVDFPATDISVSRHGGARANLSIILHFSRMVDGPTEDLEVVFNQPLAFQWEEESYGLIELPVDLPKCLPHCWSTYRQPMIQTICSLWAALYAGRVLTDSDVGVKQVMHFAFVSLNDLFHVLSINRPVLRWVTAIET